MRVRSVRCARRSIFPRGEGDSRPEEGFEKLAEGILESELKLAFAAIKNENNADEMTDKARRLMSEKGGAIRSGDKIAEAIFETEQKN